MNEISEYDLLSWHPANTSYPNCPTLHLDMDPTPVSNKILSVQILIKQSNQKNLEFFIKSEKHEVLLSLMLLIMWERMNRWEKNEGKFHVKTH